MLITLVCTVLTFQKIVGNHKEDLYKFESTMNKKSNYEFILTDTEEISVKENGGKIPARVLRKEGSQITAVSSLIVTKVFEIDTKERKLSVIQSGVFPDTTHSIFVGQGACTWK